MAYEDIKNEICDVCHREGFCVVGPWNLYERQGYESASLAFTEENGIEMED